MTRKKIVIGLRSGWFRRHDAELANRDTIWQFGRTDSNRDLRAHQRREGGGHPSP
jgi:hypothetical protein